MTSGGTGSGRSRNALVVGGVTIDHTLSEYDEKRESDQQRPCEGVPLGQKLDFRQLHRSVGGGGANVATALSRLGLHVTLCASVGDDADGRYIRRALEADGVCTSQFQTNATMQSGAAYIAQMKSAAPLILAHRGANQNIAASQVDVASNAANHLLYLTAAVGAFIESVPLVLERCKGMHPSTFIAVNPGVQQLSPSYVGYLAESFGLIDLLIINRTEAERLRESLSTRSDSRVADTKPSGDHTDIGGRYCVRELPLVAWLLSNGVRYVCITLDRDGAVLFTSATARHVSALSRKVASSLGAGDAFGSTLAFGLSVYSDPSYAMKMAAINAASVISTQDTRSGLLAFTDINAQAQELSA